MGEQEPSAQAGDASFERPYPEGTSNVERVERPPLWTLWFRPGRFHDWSAHAMPWIAFIPIVYLVLLSRSADRLISTLGEGKLAELIETWAFFWWSIALMALLFGIFSYYFLGFWYWLRLHLSGVRGRVFHKGTRIYFTSALIYALPGLIVVGIDTALHPNPFASVTRPHEISIVLGYALIPFTFWSVIASYAGVRRTIRPPRRRLAFLLFFLLPMATFGGAAWFTVWAEQSDSFARSPEFASTKVHDGAAFTFEYPSNWSIDTNWAAHDPDSSVFVLTGADAATRVQAFRYEGELTEVLDHTRKQLGGEGSTIRGRESEATVDGSRAQAWNGTLTMSGEPYEVIQRAVAPREDGWVIEVLWLSHPDIEKKLRPGFNLILDTLEITHPYDQRAVTERTREYAAAGLAFEYPSNWVASADLEASEEDPALDVGGITVDAPERSYASMLLYYSANSLQSELDITIDRLVEEGATVEDDEAIDSIGQVRGEGLRFRLVYDEENAWICRVLVARLPDERVLELREYAPTERIQLDKDGFALIWRTLRLPGESPE